MCSYWKYFCITRRITCNFVNTKNTHWERLWKLRIWQQEAGIIVCHETSWCIVCTNLTVWYRIKGYENICTKYDLSPWHYFNDIIQTHLKHIFCTTSLWRGAFSTSTLTPVQHLVPATTPCNPHPHPHRHFQYSPACMYIHVTKLADKIQHIRKTKALCHAAKAYRVSIIH